MSNKCDINDRRNVFSKCSEDIVYKVKRYDHGFRKMYEYDKKLKREIANSNERRRMQSINVGFETLKQLLPTPAEGEKLSKASILQLTAQYIQTLITRMSSLEKELSNYKKGTKPVSSPAAVVTTLDRSVLSSNPTNLLEDQAISFSNNEAVFISDDDDSQKLSNSETTISRKQTTKTRKRHLDSVAKSKLVSRRDPRNSEDDDEDEEDDHCTDVNVMYCDDSDPTGTPPGSLEHLVAAIEQVEGQQFYTDGSSIKRHHHLSSGSSRAAEVIIVDLDTAINKSDSVSNSSKLSSRQLVSAKDGKSPSVNLLNHHHHHQQQHSDKKFSVLKPTISPYTEKIIFDYSQHPHLFKPPRSTDERLSSSDQLQHTSPSAAQDNLVRRIPIPHKYLHRPDVILQKNNTL